MDNVVTYDCQYNTMNDDNLISTSLCHTIVTIILQVKQCFTVNHYETQENSNTQHRQGSTFHSYNFKAACDYLNTIYTVHHSYTNIDYITLAKILDLSLVKKRHVTVQKRHNIAPQSVL
jgi:hypothetical protein